MRKFPSFRLNLPYIWPAKFFIICTALFLFWKCLVLAFAYFHTEPYSRVDYIAPTAEAKRDVAAQVAGLGTALHAKDYGQEWWPWGVIQSHAFYGYSLVNLFLANRSDESFRVFASHELQFVYDFIQNEGRAHFTDQGTRIEHGIIYQGAKNHVLASLVILGNENYWPELENQSEFLSKALEESPEFSAESYPGIAWYIDNVHAYYSLFLVDALRKKRGEKPLYAGLIQKWTASMRSMVDERGITLAEAYGFDPAQNQARGCAQSWLLVYMYEMDPEYFRDQYAKFNAHFYREWRGLWFVNDTPDGIPRVNQFSGGPSLFGYSSSATALSLPLYKLTGEKDKFRTILRTLDFLLDYDPESGRYSFVYSTLLDSLALWGKTHVTWGDKL